MTTFSSNTVIDHTTDAGFRTWGNELMTALITTLGLTQTADTGQLAFPMTVTTRPAINTAAGYYILRFNDTLQATTPIFIKIELGTGASAGVPTIWITVGTGSNSSGTLTGLSTRIFCGNSAAPGSAVTNYVSKGCYNATQGVLWIDWKQGAPTSNTDQFNFLICRSVDNTGAPTATAIGFQGQSQNASSNVTSGTPWQWYTAFNTTWLGPASAGGLIFNDWGATPYQNTGGGGSTVEGTAGQVFPCFQYAPTASVPAVGVMNALAVCLQTEIAIGATVSLTILGSLSATYIAGMATSSTLGQKGIGITGTGFAYLRLYQ